MNAMNAMNAMSAISHLPQGQKKGPARLSDTRGS